MKSALGCASFGWQAQSAKPKRPANLASTRTREGGRIEAAQPRRRTSCQQPALSLPSAHAANCSTASLAVSCVSSAHAWNRKTIRLRDNLQIDSSRRDWTLSVAALHEFQAALDGVRNWLRTRVQSAFIHQRWRRATKGG